MSPQPIFIRKQQLHTYIPSLIYFHIWRVIYAYFTDLRNCKQVLNSIEIAYPTTGKFRKLYMYWEKGYCERKIPLSHQGSPHVMIIANSWTLLTSWVVLDATIKGASRSYNIKWPSHFISCDFFIVGTKLFFSAGYFSWYSMSMSFKLQSKKISTFMLDFFSNTYSFTFQTSR